VTFSATQLAAGGTIALALAALLTLWWQIVAQRRQAREARREARYRELVGAYTEAMDSAHAALRDLNAWAVFGAVAFWFFTPGTLTKRAVARTKLHMHQTPPDVVAALDVFDAALRRILQRAEEDRRQGSLLNFGRWMVSGGRLIGGISPPTNEDVEELRRHLAGFADAAGQHLSAVWVGPGDESTGRRRSRSQRQGRRS
jgi:hypothetical protein